MVVRHQSVCDGCGAGLSSIISGRNCRAGGILDNWIVIALHLYVRVELSLKDRSLIRCGMRAYVIRVRREQSSRARQHRFEPDGAGRRVTFGRGSGAFTHGRSDGASRSEYQPEPFSNWTLSLLKMASPSARLCCCSPPRCDARSDLDFPAAARMDSPEVWHACGAC